MGMETRTTRRQTRTTSAPQGLPLPYDVIYTVSMANSSGLHGDGEAIRTHTNGKGHRRICQGVEVEHESCLTTKDCSATMELLPSHRAENLLPFP